MSDPIGLVLAGGAGRRLGRSKGSLPRDGVPLALRAARVLQPICAGVVVSIRPGAANPAAGYPAIEDRAPAGRGPLAGIAAAFEMTSGADLLVLACDYPLVDETLMRQVADARSEAHDIVLLRGPGGRDHPLVAAWGRGMHTAVRRALDEGRLRVGALVAASRVRRLGPDSCTGLDLDRALLNVNRPADLKRLEEVS